MCLITDESHKLSDIQAEVFAYMMRLAYVEEEETLFMSRIIRCATRWSWCSAFNSYQEVTVGGDRCQILASAVVKGTDWRINSVCVLWWWGKPRYLEKASTPQARGEHANSLTSWHFANCRPSQQLTHNFKDINVEIVIVFHKNTLKYFISLNSVQPHVKGYVSQWIIIKLIKYWNNVINWRNI